MYDADKVSGFTANVFGVSILPEAIRLGNRQSRFRFPFYAVTLSTAKRHVGEWVDDQKYRSIAEKVFAYVKRNGIRYFASVARGMSAKADALHHDARRLLGNMRTLDDSDLERAFLSFTKTYSRTQGFGVLTFLYEGYLSEQLSLMVAKHHRDVGSVLSKALASPYKSFITQSNELLHRIVIAKIARKRDALVKRYMREFFFIDTNYADAPLLTPRSVLRHAQSFRHATENRQLRSRARAMLTRDEQLLVRLLQITEIIHDQRKRLNLIGNHVMYRFLHEACQRSGMPFDVARNAFWFEFELVLKNRQSFQNTLQKRRNVSILFSNGKPLYAKSIIVRPKP